MASLNAAAAGAARFMTALNAKIVSNIRGREGERKTQDVFSAFFEGLQIPIAAAMAAGNTLVAGAGHLSHSIARFIASKASLTARKANLTARKTSLPARMASLPARKASLPARKASLTRREIELTRHKDGDR